MMLLADENVDKPIVELLRVNGFEVDYVAEMDPGIPDEVVLENANSKNALLLTADKDFGEMVFRQKLLNSGVCLMRLSGLSAEAKANIVLWAMKEHSQELTGSFTVLTLSGLRIRRSQ